MFMGPAGVSTTHWPSDSLTDRQRPLAHRGRFSGFETNPYTCPGGRSMETVRVPDLRTGAIQARPLFGGVGAAGEVSVFSSAWIRQVPLSFTTTIPPIPLKPSGGSSERPRHHHQTPVA